MQPAALRVAGQLMDCKTSMEAEMQAIILAVKYCLEHGHLTENQYVLIQSDCIEAIKAYEMCQPRKNPIESKLVMEMWAFKLNLEFRHLRGHTREQRNKNIAQAICDRQSRIEMRKARKCKQFQTRKLQSNPAGIGSGNV